MLIALGSSGSITHFSAILPPFIVMSSEHLGFFVQSLENQGPGAQSVNGALVRIFYPSGFSQGGFY